MSKAVKQSIAILAVLLFVSIGVALMTLLEKQKLQNKNKSLTEQVADYQAKQTQLIAEGAKLKEQIQTFTTQLAEKDKERSKYQSQYEDLKVKFDQINGQVDQMSKERADWKDRTETITEERDRLIKELQDRPTKTVEKIVEKIVYKDRDVPVPAKPASLPVPSEQSIGNDAPAFNALAVNSEKPKEDASAVVRQAQADSDKQQKDEGHWAEILKQKAGLEIELEKAKKELDQSIIQIVELKKQSSDFELEINKLKNERDEIVRKIKYGEDLADNLSIELARAKNDQKFTAERAQKINDENSMLQSKVKQLSDTKLGLEKTIQHLGNDKDDIQKKLVESENVIQGRIDEIWKIKQNVDKRFQPGQTNNQVELSPIIVNTNGGGSAENGSNSASVRANKPGHIVSINSDNNFVIIDIGDKDGSKIGNVYRVFRGNKEIAKLEVIQVRRDISAADIKKRVTALQVGDVIR